MNIIETANLALERANNIVIEPVETGWIAIDKNKAEPEVNWPGEALCSVTTYEQAKRVAREFRADALIDWGMDTLDTEGG